MKPSVDMAAGLAQALEVSLDYLVGNTDLMIDKTLLKRMSAIQKLSAEERGHLYALMDAFLRDAGVKKALAQ